MVLAEVCWTSVMTVLTFVSSVLSTRHGPARMCSSDSGKWIAADADRRLADREIHSQLSHVFLLHPASPRFVVEFPHLYALSPISPDRVLTLPLLDFAYSVTFAIITVLHAPLVPGIWYSTVFDIPWFDFPASRITGGSFPSDKSDLEAQTVYADAFQSTPDIKQSGDHQRQSPKAPLRPPWLTLPRGSLAISVSSFTPAWAKQYNIGLTRGLHNPFDRSFDEASTNHQTLNVPSDPVQRPARVIIKPTNADRLHERDDDPFAAPSKHDTVTTKVPDDYDDKTRSLQPLAGFSNLPRWSAATTSTEINSQNQDTGKQAIGTLMVQNPSDRSSNTTAATATAIYLSPRGRKSVSSLFPHDVREEDWNLPLTKPPFRNGRGEGWTTADATQDAVPTGKGRERR